MKIKLDFITNSSSASFILYIQSDLTDIECFKIYIKRLMDRFIIEEEVSDYDKNRINKAIENIEQLTPNTYSMSDFTSMLNSIIDDMPRYMIWLILENMAHGLLKYGIRNITLKLEEDGF